MQPSPSHPATVNTHSRKCLPYSSHPLPLSLPSTRRYTRKVTPSALVLFDIDGTLVRRAGPHHRQALVEGIRRVTGLETTTEGIPVQGMLDPDILSEMLKRAHATRAQARSAMPDIQLAAERYYLRVCPALHDKHCPAVAETLDRLRRHGMLLALVTGNLERIGWRKLDRAGLRHYFSYGAFGEMAKTRGGLAAIAIREARRRHKLMPGTPISLIGDAPADIQAARQNHIRSICVRTGISAIEDLVSLHPDFLLPNLRHLRLRMLA